MLGMVMRRSFQDARQYAAWGGWIIFSICEWETSKPWLWAKDVVHILDLQDGLESYAGPGHWNDPDMLEVGNEGMTITEYRAHFTLWCILAAPLMAGNDLRNVTNEVKEILTNREVIAVDQDSLGMQGRRVKRDDDREVWAKQLADGVVMVTVKP